MQFSHAEMHQEEIMYQRIYSFWHRTGGRGQWILNGDQFVGWQRNSCTVFCATGYDNSCHIGIRGTWAIYFDCLRKSARKGWVKVYKLTWARKLYEVKK